MDNALTFYTHPMSRGRIARWMLEETGLPYEEVILEYGTTMKAPQYLAINPMGKVPALRHGQTVITEGAAICAYLADLVPEKSLAPPVGSPARGSYYRWMFFLAGPLEALMTAKYAGALAKATAAGYGTEADVLHTLEEAVAGKTHLVGDHFTTVDLYTAAMLDYYMHFGLMERNPAFENYVTPHLRRPAKLAADARDQALIAANPPAA